MFERLGSSHWDDIECERIRASSNYYDGCDRVFLQYLPGKIQPVCTQLWRKQFDNRSQSRWSYPPLQLPTMIEGMMSHILSSKQVKLMKVEGCLHVRTYVPPSGTKRHNIKSSWWWCYIQHWCYTCNSQTINYRGTTRWSERCITRYCSSLHDCMMSVGQLQLLSASLGKSSPFGIQCNIHLPAAYEVKSNRKSMI